MRKNSINYILLGSDIIREYDASGRNITYYYDISGVCGFKYNGSNYFYAKNLQGDITDIYRNDGVKYASYVYDAWGNCTITLDTNGIGTLNPFRYRGYYYDTETNLYYLKSRYYDPTTGRFLNQDGILDKRSILGYNLYAYCVNNPVNRSDKTGRNAEAATWGASMWWLSGLDGLAPFGEAIYLGGLLFFAAVEAISSAVGAETATKSIATTRDEADAKEKTIQTEPPTKTLIYRYGFAESGIEKLVPTKNDLMQPETGLSFSMRWKPGSATTTIEDINATGVLRAVQDKPGHVAVTPVGGTLEEWHKQGVGSKWTQTLYSIVWIS